MRAAYSHPDSTSASSRSGGGQRLGRCSLALALAAASVISLIVGVVALARAQMSPIQPGHLRKIQEVLHASGLAQARVALDGRGRVELQGAYEDERELDRAFSLAQTVVGVRWVSPVTPQRIKVKAWMACLESLFAGRQCGPEATTDSPEASTKSRPGPLREKHALIVGVGRFQDGRIQALKYPAKDAADVYRYLVNSSGENFPPEDVELLQDAQATRPAVVAALERIKGKAGPDDLVFLYLSSHGTPPNKYGGVHVVTSDTVVTPREQIWRTSVSEDVLRSFIQEVRAKRLIVVLDACYSNGAYAGVPGFLPPGGKSLEADEHEGYGQSRQYMAQRLLGMKDLIYEAPSGSESPSAVPHGWGKVLISASDGGERSWESDLLRNSIFTHYFLEGLVRTRGSVKAAFEYARPLVRQQVQREKGADIVQTPQVTPSRLEWDMALVPRR